MKIIANGATHPTGDVTDESDGPLVRVWSELGVDTPDEYQSRDREQASLWSKSARVYLILGLHDARV